MLTPSDHVSCRFTYLITKSSLRLHSTSRVYRPRCPLNPDEPRVLEHRNNMLSGLTPVLCHQLSLPRCLRLLPRSCSRERTQILPRRIIPSLLTLVLLPSFLQLCHKSPTAVASLLPLARLLFLLLLWAIVTANQHQHPWSRLHLQLLPRPSTHPFPVVQG